METAALVLSQLQCLEAIREARGYGELRIVLVDSSHRNLRTLRDQGSALIFNYK